MSRSYSALVQAKPGYLTRPQNEFVPDLMESWETSPDGRQYTMLFAPLINARFHRHSPQAALRIPLVLGMLLMVAALFCTLWLTP